MVQKNEKKLNIQQLLKIVHDACSGMEYLATMGFVHKVRKITPSIRDTPLIKDEALESKCPLLREL